MDCPINSQEETQRLLDYVAGRLPAGTAAEIEHHLQGCAECTRFVAAQQFVWNALSQWEPHPVGAAFDRRLQSAIAESKPVSWISRIFGPFFSPVPSLAAACLVVMAVVLLHTPDAVLTPPDTTAHIEKIEPEQVERTLDDIEMLRELDETPPSPNKASTI